MARGRGSDRDSGRRSSGHQGGGDSSRSDSRSDGSKAGSGRSRSDNTIKNGRSLRDVLGSGSTGPKSGGYVPPIRDRAPGSEASKPARRSVQYQPVMNFKAPPAGSPSAPASREPVSPRPSSAPVRPVMRPPIESSQVEKPTREIPKTEKAFEKPSYDTKSSVGKSGFEKSGPGAASTAASRTGDQVDPGWPRTRVIGTGNVPVGAAPGATAVVPGRGPVPPQGRASKEARRDGNRLYVTGTVKRHPDGFGFLIPEDASLPDIYISRQYMAGVMTNDRVEAEVFRARPMDRGSSGSERMFGEVKRVISRAHARIVGRFLPVDRRYGVIQDDGRGWGMDLRIPTEDSKGAQEGDWVAIEITDYASNDKPLTGRVISVIGDVEDPLNDVIRVIHEKGIPNEFSFQTQREAGALKPDVSSQDHQGREDIRSTPMITIDGATARDFDDAIYVENTHQGFRVLVAIADVSHYVKPGGAIDEDAYARGTSTYFPNFVVPMLPEELSNELCSLKPDVDRLCFVCEMKLDSQGVIRDYRFFEGVMNSKARVTYGEAQEVIDGEPSQRLREISGVCDNILRSADLAKILMAKRFREGSLELEIPETQVVVDSNGETIDVVRGTRLFAHRLIEELMLLTNIATARFFEDNRIHGIYRIHEEPAEENIKTVEKMLWNLLGPSRGKLGPGQGLQKKLTKALQAAATMPGGQILNVLTLRAMNQAKYSSENIGHFGLGFSHYSHFTSPIRRYPDLIAHRLIKAVLYPRYRNQGMEIEEIASAATHLSACEQRSVKAERAVISIKKARFLRRYLGQTLEGSITSVAKFGIFVTLREFEIDGLVKLESLGPDRWVFDDQNMRLYGRRTGRVFKLGDVLKVLVAQVDVSTGKIDFALEDEDAQVEEALVVFSDDEMDVEELAEAAEELVSSGRRQGRGKRAANDDINFNRSAGKKVGRGRAAKGARRHELESRAGDRPAERGEERRSGEDRRGKITPVSKSAGPKGIQAKNVGAKVQAERPGKKTKSSGRRGRKR